MRRQKRPASEIARERRLKRAKWDPIFTIIVVLVAIIGTYAFAVAMVAYSIAETSSATTDTALEIEAHAIIIDWIASLFR